ncbi:hypothetical protein M422DRAFT_30134 [Sphaerobolus stellatus SS14]|uniref:FMR1-interacting protein 1 conserved domain-containing protein n=1 Tax=Sphaerobolus stellatus (strain SS14) TaxID=990650 RepID=A0A0C9W2N0_SPHS4|nr:hypothetical protein M422DRAFT_30134 [Sphaerobolus stellatus SS14]
MQPRRGQPSRQYRPHDGSSQYGHQNYIQNGYIQQQNASQSATAQNVGARAAQALTSALANPYGQMGGGGYPSYTNPNYHAYFAQVQQRPPTTADGYTFSSTYDPTAPTVNIAGPSNVGAHDNHARVHDQNATRPPARQHNSLGPWYTPGDVRCAHQGCPFTGSQKSVEIHRMDRHLIYPASWQKNKNAKDNWDADPSLKGKPVPIPGTGLLLNTPEALDAWIAERRKRYPSKTNVEEKKRKAQEAAERGEIDPAALTARHPKRRKVEGTPLDGSGRGRGRGHLKRRGRGRGASNNTPFDQRERDHGYGTKSMAASQTNVESPMSLPSALPPRSVDSSGEASSDEEDGGGSDSNSDMDPVKDAISSKKYPKFPGSTVDDNDVRDNPDSDTGGHVPHDPNVPVTSALPTVRRCKPPGPLYPKPPPPNPFASRPSLLRNLLLPEIRHTVSHLSQAIHFLVENNFLEGVELKPGDADKQHIKVIGSTKV